MASYLLSAYDRRVMALCIKRLQRNERGVSIYRLWTMKSRNSRLETRSLTIKTENNANN